MVKILLAVLLLLSTNHLQAQASATALVAATIEQAIGTEELTQSVQQYVMLSSDQPVQSFAAPAPFGYNRSFDLARFRIINSSLLYTISIVSDFCERIPMKKAEASHSGNINIKPLPSLAGSEAFVVETTVAFNHLSGASAATSDKLYVAVHFD